MKIDFLEIIELDIPFRKSFEHHSAKRFKMQSVMVIVSAGKRKGYGEGCPREYVTNESIASAIKFVSEIKTAVLREVTNLIDLKQFKINNQSAIKENPAAWCAVELAILDLLATNNRCSVEKLLDLPELQGTYKYTAIIGAGSFSHFAANVDDHIAWGFNDFKIKITGDLSLDKKKLLYVREKSHQCRVRIDANNLWDSEDTAINYIRQLPYEVMGIEEPLVERSISKLKNFSEKINTRIILDESFTSLEQFDELLSCQKHFILNLRVSKLGGLLNTLQIAQKAGEEGFDLIIGAQVGESSILTRAALCAAAGIKNKLIAMEGAYGTLLLEEDLIKTPLMFKHGGLLTISAFELLPHGFGLGLAKA
jgi:L-alanine-DL-glutamate epimerase-like enolase superfamily enzyme